MSKYDFELDLSQDSSTGLILSRIDKGAAVLEFGCAAGRMTRYMKEALDCRVYIVEYDRDTFETAMQYAEDGLCDDIQNYRWAEKFHGMEFDAIIFADVLEHLTEPEAVLKRAADFLRENGSLYASIPNITHNDILLKACADRFDYTPTGLLDDTHVHFWGLQNLEILARNCGLHLSRVEGTYCPMGYTEQYADDGRVEHLLLENILRERTCGAVYQFILTFDKCGEGEPVCELRTPAIQSRVYTDTGKGFAAEEQIVFDSVFSGHGSYLARCEIAGRSGLRGIKFDPVEFQGCVLRHLMIRQGARVCPVTAPDGIETENGMILPGKDPAVYAEIPAENEPVFLEAEILLPGTIYINELEAVCADQNGMLECLHEEAARSASEAVRSAAEAAEQIAHLTDDNRELHGELQAYIALVNGKDKRAIALERELEACGNTIADREERIRLLERELEESRSIVRERESHIFALQQQVNYYQNIGVVRLRAFILRVLRGIKRRLKRLFIKE